MLWYPQHPKISNRNQYLLNVHANIKISIRSAQKILTKKWYMIMIQYVYVKVLSNLTNDHKTIKLLIKK